MSVHSVRIEDVLTERLDDLAEAMSKRVGGANISRANAIRAALVRGVDELENEYGIRRAKPRPKHR